MYQVIKDNVIFHVYDKEKAVQYAKDGYEVYLRTKLKLNGSDLAEDSGIDKIAVSGTSETVEIEMEQRK